MAIISATALLRSISIFHITTAYYLLTSPMKIADQNFVYILGAAMDVPSAPPSLTSQSSALALSALFLSFLGISDLVATNLHEEVASFYWSAQAPIRLAFFLAVTAYTYLWKPPGGGAVSDLGGARRALGKGNEGLNELLCNSVVFTWAFMELMIFVTLRDERRDMTAKKEERRKAEDNRL
ncbi:hypothetical protein ACLMJK_005997 [Lecanora helva]